MRGGFLYFGKKRQPRLAYRRGGGRNCFLPFNSCIAYGKPRRTHAEHAFPPCNYYAVLSNRRNFGRKPKFAAQIHIVERVDFSTRSWRECRSQKSKIFGCTPYSCGTQRKYSLGARIFFDRGAITPSFNPPQAAVGCYAPPIPPQCS